MMIRLFIIIVAGLLLAGCNGAEESSPFAELLGRPPYNSLTDSIKKEPGRDDLYFRRAILLNKNNLPEPALADFRKAWAISKQEPYALGVSNILLEKNSTETTTFLMEALKDLPRSILLQLSLARAYDAENKVDEALKVCNAILEEHPLQINALLLQSELLQKKGEPAGSVAALEKAYGQVPDNLDLSYKLAYQYAETKNPKAISLADSLIAKDSLKLHAEPYYVKGLYYSNIDDKQKAIQWFNETIKQNYNYLNAYIEKGKVLLDQKKMAEALKTFELANKVSPSFADAWYWMGRVQEEMGKKEEAKINYEKAYGLDQTFTEAKEAANRL